MNLTQREVLTLLNIARKLVTQTLNVSSVMDFPQFLKRVRTELELSQTQMAKLLHVHPNTIGNIESGGSNPGLAIVEELATALGVPVKYVPERGWVI